MVIGNRMRVTISNLDHWQKQVAECLNGQTGTVEAVKECSFNGFPCGSRALLVKLDKRVFPDHPSACYSLGFESFWFAPCDLIKEGER